MLIEKSTQNPALMKTVYANGESAPKSPALMDRCREKKGGKKKHKDTNKQTKKQIKS
jgi:hypothetical protein